MSLKTLIANTVEYNNWVVNKYVDWLATKSDAQLNEDVASSFPTILKTLQHIWQTQEYWWTFIAEEYNFDFSLTLTTKEETFHALKNSAQKLLQYVDSLSEEDLTKNIKVESPWFQCDFSRYEYIQHVIMHGTYHRGQIVTMGRNI